MRTFLATVALSVISITMSQPVASFPPEACGDRDITPLSLTEPWRERLIPGEPADPSDEVHCLAIEMEPGQRVRITASMDAEPPWSLVGMHLFAPDGEQPVFWTFLGNLDRQSFSWRAESAGTHHLKLSDTWTLRDLPHIEVRVRIDAMEPAETVTAQDAALASDPRVAWLTEHAIPLNSIDPADDDFSDLEPLRASLEGVRMVLLGEADHDSGSDFLAKTRLVRFLHQELGYDVLAMESPMYDKEIVWQELQAGEPAHETFALAAIHHWSSSEQMVPLIEYVAAQATGDTPLELAGIDNQPLHASMNHFMDDLTAFLHTHGIGGPLAEPGTQEREVLTALAEVRYRQRLQERPGMPVRHRFIEEIDRVTGKAAALDGTENEFWAQVLQGMACHGRRVLRGDGIEFCDRPLGENLVWLADSRFPDRKIIVWAGSAHMMRLEELPPAAGSSGPSAGQYAWDALGDESYVIAVTSYRDDRRTINPDQHPLFEFEQLMHAAGFEYSIVDLRKGAREGDWTGDAFPARPNLHGTQSRTWSEHADAFLFVRDQVRSRRMTD